MNFMDALQDFDEVKTSGSLIGVRSGEAFAVLEPDPDNGRVLIKKIIVSEHCRGRGEGTRLLLNIFAAADRSQKNLALVAIPLEHPAPHDKQAWNTAVSDLNRFYDRLGFSNQPLRERHFTPCVPSGPSSSGP